MIGLYFGTALFIMKEEIAVKEYYLSELLELKYGKDHKTLGNGTIPCYGSGGVIRYVNNSLYEKESILIPRKGSLNNLFFINKPFWTVDTLFWSIINEKIVLPRYLFYKLKNLNLSSFNEGSAVPSLTTKTLNKISIKIHDLKLQEKIVSILSLLDEKIELNKKINQNLEEICQNYFLEIFIKNSNKNCSVGQISDLGNIVSGATPSKKNLKYYTNFGIPWITPKDLSKNFNKFISRGNLDITELGFKNSSVRLLPKGSVLFSSRAPIGYIAICSNDVTTNQGFKSIVPFKNIGTEFVYYFLKNNVQFLESRASGSTFKEISTTIMATTPAIIPKEDPLKVFKKICINIFEKQYIIEKETEKLIELRDYLLPKLMNGEIDVSNLKISEILNSDKFN